MVDCDTTEMTTVPKPGRLLGMRHVMACLMFLGTTVSYATRVSMSVGIVAMTSNNSYGHPVFTHWTRSIQDTILSSFFWGYIVLQIPAGYIAGRFGGKYLMLISMATTGVVNLLLPIAAVKGDYMAVCACRIVMGLVQGLLYPSLHGVLGHWVPVTERSRLGTFVYAGAQLGTIVELLTSGVLAASPWGWPSVFYVAGICCIVWSVLWIILGDSTPGSSRWISKEERNYIEYNAGSNDIGHEKIPTPWKGILTCLPFWAILLAHCGQNLGFWTLLTELPSYMKNVLNVDIKENGQLSALPYVAMYILSFFFSWLADFLVNRKIIKLVTSRRIFNTIAQWGPAVALLGLSYLPAGNLSLAVIILTVTCGLNGAHYVGFMLSHIDLSPNHASTMMGFTNGIGAIFSILAPLSVSFVVEDETSAADWRKVFFISVAFYFLANLFYLLFISADIQPWNEPKPKALEDGVKKSDEKNADEKSKNMGEHKF
ncbi:putative inorganic phosphate cotransporter [Spodoptera litura]|uniref:Putative inorganic phosphate cotransporter n=1 Tax=Spodoptera litura TaxID=69820 RepID=A0A9J7DQT0_SPOLT|nr:putative inorganic phosphate cotransporter [Spodoptera litura]